MGVAIAKRVKYSRLSRGGTYKRSCFTASGGMGHNGINRYAP